ncbi:MAG: menaquinone-dependent protoporphyrinogen IX dehydrogenase [Betaproteobacteria bacterium]|nr:menaquinone-dependent protoporphyrinogen IX dehydrogenase [Betaproteobacteria bacterium]
MLRTLMAYSTVDGQTLKICGRIQQVLEAAGCTMTLFEIGDGKTCDLAPFDTIVIGASIRYGKHRPDVYRFIESKRAALDGKPSAFFSVNVVARKVGKDRPESNPYLQTFRRKTTWAPREVGVFAGKIDYLRYRFIDRQVIRLIMWLTNGPTDPKGCTDFTDWHAVEGFAQRISTLS